MQTPAVSNAIFTLHLRRVTLPAYGSDPLAIRVTDFVPDPFDIHGQCIVIDKTAVHIPQTLQYHSAGKHLARMLQKQQEQPVFQCRKRHFFFIDPYFHFQRIDIHIAQTVRNRIFFPARPAQNTRDPGQQFPQTKGLSDIVDRAEFQPHHDIASSSIADRMRIGVVVFCSFRQIS